MPLRRKSNLNIKVPGQSVEKSMSSPDLSLGRERNKMDNQADQSAEVTVKRKKSWLSKLFSPFRKKRNRTITSPSTSAEYEASCFPIQKSVSSQFYTSTPYNLLLEATRCNEDDTDNQVDGLKQLGIAGEVSRDPISSQVSPLPLPPKLIEELKSNIIMNRYDDKISKLEKQDNETDINHVLISKISKAENSIINQYPDLENTYGKNMNIVDGILPEISTHTTSPESYMKTMFRDDPDLSRSPDLEPQPIEPLHKFPKPKPPVKRRPSTRRGSKTAEDDLFMNPRRSQAELEEVLEKLKHIPPPPEVIVSNEIPIPKKKMKILPTLNYTEPVTNVCLEDNLTPHSTVKAKTGFEFNDNTFKQKQIPGETCDSFSQDDSFQIKSHVSTLGRNTLPKSTMKNSDSIPSISNLIERFNNINLDIKKNVEDNNPHPLKRWKTLPTSFQWSSVTKITSSLASQESENQSYINQTNSLLKENWTQTLLEDVLAVSEIKSEKNHQNDSASSSLDPYIEKFQRVIKKYINDSNWKRNYDQSTPPNTPEQLGEFNSIDNANKNDNNSTLDDEIHRAHESMSYTETAKDEHSINHGISESYIWTKSSTSAKVPEGNSTIVWNDEIFQMDSFANEDCSNKKIYSRHSKKPLISPKPEVFVRRGGLRQKRRASSSDDQTMTPEVVENQHEVSNVDKCNNEYFKSQNNDDFYSNHSSINNVNNSPKILQSTDSVKNRSNSII